MSKLIELIKKDFRLLTRSKTSSLIIFVGPLLLVALLGLAYSQSSTFSLTASVYSSSYSELTDALVGKLDSQDVGVIKHATLDDCVGSLKRGESHACIHFPPNMSIEEGNVNEVTFYVDYSQINLVWIILDVMNTRVSEKSEEISKDLTDDLLNRLWFVETKINAANEILEEVKTANTDLKEDSGTMKSGFQGLDINVDFAVIDITKGRDSINAITPSMTDIQEALVALTSEVGTEVSDLKDSLDILESIGCSSSEISDIRSSVGDIKSAISDAGIEMSRIQANATISIDAVIELIDVIDGKLIETKAKINNVKKSRDDLIPEFDSVNTKIDNIRISIGKVESSLDEALQKIQAVKIRNAERIVAPITTKIEPVTTQKTHFNSLFPSLLVLIIMITSILLASTLVIVEKKSKAFFRNSMAPTSFFTFSLGTYLTGLIVVVIQLILFISVSAFFFETEVITSLWILSVLLFLITTVFLCIGMLIGFIFKNEETVTLASITLASIFLLFSSVVIPLESMSSYIKSIALYNPFVVSEMALKQAVIFQFSIDKILANIGILVAYAVGIFLVMILLQKTFGLLAYVHLKMGSSQEKKGSFRLFGSGDKKNKKVEGNNIDINELAVPKSEDKSKK